MTGLNFQQLIASLKSFFQNISPLQLLMGAVGLATVGLLIYLIGLGPKDILGWLASLFATFLGAYFAFKFAAAREKRDRVTKNIEAANLTLLTLIEFVDRLMQYQHIFVNPVRNNPLAWFAMRPGQQIDSLKWEIDKSALLFLLQRYPEIWRTIVLEERRYVLLASQVDERTRIMNEEVWPKLEAAGFAHGQAILPDQVVAALGPTITENLRGTTRFIVENTDSDIETLQAAIVAFREALVELYPDEKFVGIPIPIAMA